MPTNQTTRQNAPGKDSEALQSLINDQAEARLKKEINISRSEAENKTQSKPDTSSSGAQTRAQPAGIRKPPTMKETKAQLIKKVEKLIAELDKIEAKLEQKDLEAEKYEKSRQDLLTDMEKVKQEKAAIEIELKNKEEASAAVNEKEKELAAKIQELQKENEAISAQMQEKELANQTLEREKQDLLGRFSDLESRVRDVAELESAYKAKLNDKDSELYVLNQEKIKLMEEMGNMKKEISAQENVSAGESKQTDAEQWREKAGALWDGTAYSAPQKAIYYLNAALELKPNWPQVLNDRGLAYLDEYQLDKSLDDFTAAIAIKSDFAEAYHNRAVALLKAGKSYAANKDFQIAAKYGLWMGLNSVSTPVKKSALKDMIEKLKKLLGMGRKK